MNNNNNFRVFSGLQLSVATVCNLGASLRKCIVYKKLMHDIEMNPGPIKAGFLGTIITHWDITGSEAHTYYEAHVDEFHALAEMYNSDTYDLDTFARAAYNVSHVRHFAWSYVCLLITRRDPDDLARASVLYEAFENEVEPQAGEGEESKDGACDYTATTKFADDAELNETCFPTKVLDIDRDVGMTDISDFLSRPYLVGNYSWSTAALVNTNLMTVNVAAALLSNAHWVSKLEGYNMIRATCHLRVALNANPFQQGALLVRFLPQVAELGSYNVLSYRNANLTTKTQHPGLHLQCKDTAAVLSVPYIAPTSFYTRSGASYGWGSFYIDILSPLNIGVGGINNVDVSVYMYFSDVELAAPIIPQSESGGGLRKPKYAKTIGKAESLACDSGKPISSILSATGRFAGSLAAIPQLAPVAEPATWVAEGLSSLFAYFGYSKPLIDQTQSAVLRNGDRYGAVFDGADHSIPLGLSSTNAISHTDAVSLYNEDESSFAFLKTREAYINTFVWSYDSLSNSSLYTKTLGPRNLYTAGTTVKSAITVNWRTGPPVFYLSHLFAFWRGSIVFKFKLIKTNFHTGRLQITYTPSASSATIPTIFDSDISLREIVDISTSDEFELVFPYMLPTSYVDMSTTMGTIDVKVLNELRAPQTASQSIEVLVFARAGADFELANPGAMDSSKQAFNPQSGEDKELVSGPVGGVSYGGVSTVHAEHSTGEVFKGIRQLLQRWSQVYMKVFPTNSTALGIYPYFFSMAYQTAAGAISGPVAGGDTLSFIAPMYHYFRGGVRYKVLTSPVSAPSGTNNPNMPVHISHYPNGVLNKKIVDIGYTTLGDIMVNQWPGLANNGLGVGIANSDSGLGYVGALVPYYSRTKCSLILPSTSDDLIKFNDLSTPYSFLNLSSYAGINSPVIMRAINDDFQFSYFLGCPPILY